MNDFATLPDIVHTTTQLLHAGVDEAGRGPLCGEVVAAAVVLDPARPIDGLGDSKKLSEKKRDALFPVIQERARAWAIATASVDEIDQLNILQATLLAMQRAVEQLFVFDPTLEIEKVLVDGNQPPRLRWPVETVVKGDAKIQAISAASILAKVHRDQLCLQMEDRYPGYGFAVHKGYPTADHLAALQRLGPCALHRKSFGPVKKILTRSTT